METMTVDELVEQLGRYPGNRKVLLSISPDTGDEANPHQRGGVLQVSGGMVDDRMVVFLGGHTA